MARENRAENRAKAKEAATGSNQGGTDPNELDPENDVPSKQSFDDIINAHEGDDDDDTADTGLSSEAEDKKEEEEENAAGSESFEATPPVVKKEGEEEAKKTEAEAGKETDGKKAEDATSEAKKPEDQKVAETPAVPPVSAEPTSKEKEETERVKPLSDEEATKLFSDWRNETENLLAQHHYRLSEKDVEEFNENPASFIPKYASRVYLDCISASFQQFATYLPRMVNQVLEMNRSTEAKENKFFETWSELKPHRETVLRLGAAYRASNPSASEDDFIREVGAQAMVALRLTPNGHAQAQAPEQKPAFIPAAQSATPTPPKQPSNNPFEQMASDFSFEDLPDDA